MANRGNIVPEPTSVVHPTISTKKCTKRSSKAVRQRKSESRRITLNKFTQERVKKSFKINIVQVDDQEIDFADAFAFFSWYQENYARLDDIPKPLAIKFRDQYLALNVAPEEDEWLRETIQHKFLFDDCYYEKMVNSDSDESVFDVVHKLDQITVIDDRSTTEQPRFESPTYRADSPVYAYCNTTDYSGSSDDTSGPAAEILTLNSTSDRIIRPSTPVESLFVMEYDSAQSTKTILYKDLGARRLCNQMTEDDYRDINDRKTKLLKRSPTSNVKLRYGSVTLYLKFDSIYCYHKSDCDPIVSVDTRLWSVRQGDFLFLPQLIVRSKDEHIVKIVAMG